MKDQKKDAKRDRDNYAVNLRKAKREVVNYPVANHYSIYREELQKRRRGFTSS